METVAIRAAKDTIARGLNVLHAHGFDGSDGLIAGGAAGQQDCEHSEFEFHVFISVERLPSDGLGGMALPGGMRCPSRACVAEGSGWQCYCLLNVWYIAFAFFLAVIASSAESNNPT